MDARKLDSVRARYRGATEGDVDDPDFQNMGDVYEACESHHGGPLR